VELADHLRRLCRGQQTAFACHQAGGKSHREPVAIDAQIQYVTTGRQALREFVHVGKESPRIDRR